jgi:CRP/FNR family transcriptional regulator, dissimilatory nitrate respiration regulator
MDAAVDHKRGLLRNLAMFRDLADDELERIAAGVREVRAARGEIIFRQGDPCEGFHMVVFGQVKLAFASPQGMEKVVEIIAPGMSFGEALMFMERPYIVYAQTLADSLLLHISKDVIFAGLESNPTLARRMLAGMSWRLHAIMKDLEAITLRNGTQRVIGYLLRDEDEALQGPLSVKLPASKGIVASRLNLTPEHFSRILHDLAADGLIAVDGREVLIKDPEKLRRHEG